MIENVSFLNQKVETEKMDHFNYFGILRSQLDGKFKTKIGIFFSHENILEKKFTKMFYFLAKK